MDLSALGDALAYVGVLAKDIGKGGGGSTEEPTVCISLLPVALGVVFVLIRGLRDFSKSGRRRLAARAPDTA